MRIFVNLLLSIAIFSSVNAKAQLVDSLVINTGYTNISKDTVILGQQDPNWTITDISTSLLQKNNLLTLPLNKSLPYKAYTSKVWYVPYHPFTVTTPQQTHWLAYGPNRMDNRIPGAEPDTAGHYVTFERNFKLCNEDNITIDMDILCDNFLTAVYIDSTRIVLNQGNLTHFYKVPYQLTNSTHALSQGVHTIKIIVRNQPAITTAKDPNNPAGLNVVGKIKAANQSIIDVENFPNFSCDDSDPTTIETLANRSFSFNLYPNPFNDYISVNYDIQNTTAEANIVIYNVVGKKVHQQNISVRRGNVRINTSTLPKGMYVCALVIDGISVATNKIVK